MGRNRDAGAALTKTVVILGGGLAGLSAARCLIERGYHVTLVEKRPFLGGRAYSFYDRQAKCEVDNGQHIFMGCCTYYQDLLRALGVADKTYLQDRLRTEVVLDQVSGYLYSTPFLGALHLLPSFIRYPHLGIRDKLLATYALLKIKTISSRKLTGELDDQTFYEWLKRHRQTERAVDNLWNLIILPALNDDVRHVSAGMGLMMFKESLLGGPRDAAIGFSKVGLTSLVDGPGRRFLEVRGGTLRMGASFKTFRLQAGCITAAELADGTVLRADHYVSALPFDVLAQAMPDGMMAKPYFSDAAKLESSPIVGIHLWYERPVMDQRFVGFLDSPVQWVFNRSLIQGSGDQSGQYLCISISGAWDYIDRPKEEIRDVFAREMERLFPRARDAQIERSLVVKQPQATFRSVPGTAANRPSQVTPIPNLTLAGEWSDTGWPSTMEGAVRSGVMAADVVASRG